MTATAHPQRYARPRARMAERHERLRAALPASAETLHGLYRAEPNTAAWRRLYRDLEAIGAHQTRQGEWLPKETPRRPVPSCDASCRGTPECDCTPF